MSLSRSFVIDYGDVDAADREPHPVSRSGCCCSDCCERALFGMWLLSVYRLMFLLTVLPAA